MLLSAYNIISQIKIVHFRQDPA